MEIDVGGRWRSILPVDVMMSLKDVLDMISELIGVNRDILEIFINGDMRDSVVDIVISILTTNIFTIPRLNIVWLGFGY